MKALLWLLALSFLVGGTITGIGASIGALDSEWFAVCIFCIAGMFSAAEWADKYDA